VLLFAIESGAAHFGVTPHTFYCIGMSPRFLIFKFKFVIDGQVLVLVDFAVGKDGFSNFIEVSDLILIPD